MELILIGFMGSGKTTVSRLLGEMLNTPVTDLDVEIVRRAGMPIADIFAQNASHTSVSWNMYLSRYSEI